MKGQSGSRSSPAPFVLCAFLSCVYFCPVCISHLVCISIQCSSPSSVHLPSRVHLHPLHISIPSASASSVHLHPVCFSILCASPFCVHFHSMCISIPCTSPSCVHLSCRVHLHLVFISNPCASPSRVYLHSRYIFIPCASPSLVHLHPVCKGP